MNTSKKSITDIEGVFASGIHCGVKSDKKDLAYIYVPDAVSCAGVFTQNKVVAPSVVHDRKALKSGVIKAAIINSGNANTGLGKSGADNTKKMAQQTADLLGLKTMQVAVSSTGIIGVPLPFEAIESGITSILADPKQKDGQGAAEAILTTDLCTKQVYKEAKIGKKIIQIAGMTKGSGMIAPNMATTLGYLATNANIPQQQLQDALNAAIDMSYNMSSVDTDTSTSDTVLCWATGQHNVNVRNKTEWEAFQTLLNEVCIEMAKLVVRDGEGATKLIEVTINGAPTVKEARAIAKSVIDSPLVKTAIYGNDPNWGRLLMAAGKPDTRLNPDKLSVFIGDHVLYQDGDAVEFDHEAIVAVLKKDPVNITFELNIGSATATAWGCDLTERYIEINTDYN
ncbi:bifunctional glutamate N-acetyltransferase/amino-acid acetyltransferase ArgJ [bacterium]|nr:bifunctional glutamate N-acetyltransferase/amino-acid acetyltransferase ArgJ [bacterium]